MLKKQKDKPIRVVILFLLMISSKVGQKSPYPTPTHGIMHFFLELKMKTYVFEQSAAAQHA